MTRPWYETVLLVDPDRVVANAARMRAANVVDVSPTSWQLCLGVLRLWHRVVFRSETVGTSQLPVRKTWRARLLANRAIRLPCLLASGAVIPFDFTGLRSEPGRLIEHLLGAHHDGNQFVFDLELLAGHGALDELAARAGAVLDGSDPRAEWLRDLVVHVGYHEALAAAAARARTSGPAMAPKDAADPDMTLRGLFAWCARQPATPSATLAAWRAGDFHLGPVPEPTAPTREAILGATGRELAAWLAAGHPVAPEQLAGAEYRGTSLGLPAWIERVTWKHFIKAFAADGERVRGWNVRIDQKTRAPLRQFGHFVVVREGNTTVLDYGLGATGRFDPLATVRDPLVSLQPGSADLLLGRSLIEVAGRRVPTPSYFLLERAPALGDRRV